MAGRQDFFDARHFMHSLKEGRMRPRALFRAGTRVARLFATTTWMGVKFSWDAKGLHGRDPLLGARRLQVWGDFVGRLFQIDVEVTGRFPWSDGDRKGASSSHGVLLMANHRSDADIPILAALLPLTFIARHDIVDFPVIGWGAKLANTILVNQGDPASGRRVREEVAERLAGGFNILTFPEGKAQAGPELAPFKPGLFYRVAGLDIKIVPVTIYYPPEMHIEWTRDHGPPLIEHILELAGRADLSAKVHFDEPVNCLAFSDGAALHDLVRSTIQHRYDQLSAGNGGVVA